MYNVIEGQSGSHVLGLYSSIHLREGPMDLS
jgi:hypothetical protein